MANIIKKIDSNITSLFKIRAKLDKNFQYEQITKILQTTDSILKNITMAANEIKRVVIGVAAKMFLSNIFAHT